MLATTRNASRLHDDMRSTVYFLSFESSACVSLFPVLMCVSWFPEFPCLSLLLGCAGCAVVLFVGMCVGG